MSGQPVKGPRDAENFRKAYLATLDVMIQNNEKNLQANLLHKRTGQISSQITDYRTPSEKFADATALKVDVRQQLRRICDVPNSERIVAQLGDDDIRFVAQHIEQIVKELQPKYRYGIDEPHFMAYLRKLQKVETEASGVPEDTVTARLSSFVTFEDIGTSLVPQDYLESLVDKIRDMLGAGDDDAVAFAVLCGAYNDLYKEIENVAEEVRKRTISPIEINQVMKILRRVVVDLITPDDAERFNAKLGEVGADDRAEVRQQLSEFMNKMGSEADLESKEAEVHDLFIQLQNTGRPEDIRQRQQLAEQDELEKYGKTVRGLARLGKVAKEKVRRTKRAKAIADLTYLGRRAKETEPETLARIEQTKRGKQNVVEEITRKREAKEERERQEEEGRRLAEQQKQRVARVPKRLEAKKAQSSFRVSKTPLKTLQEEKGEDLFGPEPPVSPLKDLKLDELRELARDKGLLTGYNKAGNKDGKVAFLERAGIKPPPFHFQGSYAPAGATVKKGKGIADESGPSSLGSRTLSRAMHDPNAPPSRYNEGFGVRKISGRGIVEEKGVHKKVIFAPFGRHFINLVKLDSDILCFSRAKGTNIANLKTRRVSADLASVIRKMVNGGTPSFNDLTKLSEEDKRMYADVLGKCHIPSGEGIDIPNQSSDGDMKKFEIMKGELLSGNDSTQLIKEFKVLIVKLIHQSRLPKAEGKELLMDLATLGY
jgi:hypothetical protein